MKLLEFKKELLTACFAEIDDRVASLRKVMDEAQQSANDYGQPKDRYDSYRTQLLRKRDLFGQQLYKIFEQRNILEKVNAGKTSDIVEFGAIVVTNQQKVFVSVGLGKIECRGGDYFVISPGVPIFKAMEGMKAGDSFEFRGQKINILEIS